MAYHAIFMVWDTITGKPLENEGGNLTLRLFRDTAELIPTNGYARALDRYHIELTDAEVNARFVILAGKSSTPGAIVYPHTIIKAEKNVGLIFYFFAIDTFMRTQIIGDHHNMIVYIMSNGSIIEAVRTIVQPDSYNAPGLYRVVLTADEMDVTELTIVVISSTPDVWIGMTNIMTYERKTYVTDRRKPFVEERR